MSTTEVMVDTEKGRFYVIADTLELASMGCKAIAAHIRDSKDAGTCGAGRLTLEVGKTYVTADGTPVKIEYEDADVEYSMVGSDGDCYMRDGRCWVVPNEGDLIAELQEPGAVQVGADAAAPAPQPAEDRGFFLDQLMFEIIRANPGAASQYLCHAFLALADARSQA